MLLERDPELAELARTVDAAAAGDGQLVTIAGPAGIGKSTLLARARTLASDRDFRLLTASASTLERPFSHGVCRQLFEPAVRHADVVDRDALLGGAAEIGVRLLLSPPRGTEKAPADYPDSYAARHGLYWLTASLAEERPLLITLDDAQWADSESLGVLHYLSHRLDGLPVAVVVAVREAADDPGIEPDDELLRAVLAPPGGQVIRPSSLSREATARMIERELGTEPAGDFVAACRRSTGGNPYYLAELLRTLASSRLVPSSENSARLSRIGPPAISREVLGRVVQLGPGCADLVRALAVLGGTAELPVTAELAGLEASQAARCADRLAAASVLAARLPLQFCHPIMQAAVYDDIPPLERATAHRRAAELLDARSAGRSEVAVHLLHTQPGDDRWTRDRTRDAADQARAEGATAAAIEFLRRALAESPAEVERFELTSTLGQALVDRGSPEGLELLRAALTCAPDAEARARAAMPLSAALVYADRAAEAVTVLEGALSELTGTADADRIGSELEALLVVMGITDLAARRYLQRRLHRTVERFRAEPASIGDSVLPPLAFQLIFDGAGADEAAAIAERAFCTGNLLRRDRASWPVPYVAAYALIATGRATRAEQELDDSVRRSTRSGAGRDLALGYATRSLARLRRGDLHGASADCEDYFRLSAEQPPPIFAPIALATAVTVHLERGEIAEAQAVSSSAAADSVNPDSVLSQPLLESRARLCFAQGDHQAGLTQLTHCRSWALAWAENSGSWPVQWRSLMAMAERHRGDAAAARELAATDVALARSFGAPLPLGRALMAEGMCTGGAEGIALLGEAAETLQGSEHRLDYARAQVELGAAIRRQGARVAARAPLTAGLKLARSCGAIVLAERAYTELRSAGARPAKIIRTGPGALTPSELRVARLAAEGSTNRDIAQSLFVTQKTIEVHLSHAYQKLGIASRSELTAALGEQPDNEPRAAVDSPTTPGP